MKPRNFIDPAEALRVHLWGARAMIEAADKSDGLARVLNQAGARAHILAALRILAKDTPS